MESRWQTAFLHWTRWRWRAKRRPNLMCLLKNEGGALPLSKQVKKLALIGRLPTMSRTVRLLVFARPHQRRRFTCRRHSGKLSEGSQLFVARGCPLMRMEKARSL